jgi:hypothetical protein
MARPAADRSAPALSAALGRLGRSLGLATATGYIWLFYSERVFWSFWRAEDGVAALLATWAVYSVAAHAALIAIWRFHVRGLAAVLLIGAFFGWLIEGVFAMTLFGADGIPFPLTISWTGLAWHDLISVTIGWYALQLAMRRGPRPTAALALGLGVFWGLWSLSWIAADRGATPGLAAFAVHAFAATAAMIAASYAYCELRCSDFAPGRVEQALTAAVILAWLGGLTLPRLGARAIVLVPLFGLLWWGLRRTRATATGPDLLALLAAPIDRRSVPVLLLMPAAAALIYSLCRTAGLTPATNILVFVITTPAGFIALIAGLVAVCRRTRRL